MAGPLVLDRAAIAAACERYGVKRLVIFGSAVTGRFNESTSDVDFLVEFRDDVVNRFDAYFGLKESLEALLGHPVDLVSPVALENPYFAASVAENGHEVYAA
jgi:predicted nucleotidyltransferase